MKQIVLAMVFVMLAVAMTQARETSVPPLVNYQGMLADADGKPLTGTKKIEFSLYDAATGGNKVWGPQIFSNVPLVNGMFNVILGTTDTEGRSIADAFGGKDRYLGIKVSSQTKRDMDGIPDGWDFEQSYEDEGELKPRQQILSTPFAIQAAQADIAKTVQGDNLYVHPSSNKVGIGTKSPTEKLHVNGTIYAESVRFADGTVQESAGLPPADYDSGWFSVSKGSTYNKTHDLGDYPTFAVIWGSASSSGSNRVLSERLGSKGCNLKDVTPTSYLYFRTFL